MIPWYKSTDLEIYFNVMPDCGMRYPEPNATEEEIQEITKKPLILKNEVFCLIKYQGIVYCFIIKAGYIWDGATIPPWAWLIIGSKLDPRFLIASLIHDNLCENHQFINNDRYASTKVFVAFLEEAGVGSVKRFLMFHSVDNYQKVRGGWNQ